MVPFLARLRASLAHGLTRYAAVNNDRRQPGRVAAIRAVGTGGGAAAERYLIWQLDGSTVGNEPAVKRAAGCGGRTPKRVARPPSAWPVYQRRARPTLPGLRPDHIGPGHGAAAAAAAARRHVYRPGKCMVP